MATDSKDLLEEFDPLSDTLATNHAPNEESDQEEDVAMCTSPPPVVTTPINLPTPGPIDSHPVTTPIDNDLTTPSAPELPNLSIATPTVNQATPCLPDASDATPRVNQATPFLPDVSDATPRVNQATPCLPDASDATPITPTTTSGPIPMTPVSEKPLLATPIPDHMTQTTPTSVAVSSPKKKKKKKRKKHSSSKKEGPKAGHMTSAQINSDISEIDSFLESLKMGVPSMTPITIATTTTKTTPLPPHPIAQVKGVVSSGLQLISQFDSSGSSSEDTSESSSESSEEEESIAVVIEELEGGDDGGEGDDVKKGSHHNYPMIRNEIHYRDLPPLESCDIDFPEGAEMVALGRVSHITEGLVVIQSLPDTPPVDEGTVLWFSDKKSISVVFEIFGPVKCPYYSVHVHSPEHAHTLGLETGKILYVVPSNTELTKYVFTQQLMKQRGSDASWKDDSEVTAENQDFSDDEAEQTKKRKGKRPQRDTPSAIPPPGPGGAVRRDQTPRYSNNPKMRAYFPRAAPLQSTRPPSLPPPPPSSNQYFPAFQGGVPYLTPRGFMGILPPGYGMPPGHGAMHPRLPPAPSGYPYPPPPGQYPPPPLMNQQHPPPLMNQPHPPPLNQSRPPYSMNQYY